MNIHEFRKMVDSISDNEPSYSDKEVTVKIVPMDNRVFGSTPSTKVTGIWSGFDWDGWQVIIYTEDRLVIQE